MTEGRNKWEPRNFREALTRAGNVIRCSWGVMGVRRKSTGEMAVLIVFNDDDKKEFSFAFDVGTGQEVFALAHDLETLATKIKNGKIENGEIGFGPSHLVRCVKCEGEYINGSTCPRCFE